MERQLTHSMASSSSVGVLRPSLRAPLVLAASRPLRQPRLRCVPVAAGLAMPAPSSSQAQAVGQIVPSPTREGDDVLRVTTMHSPEELQSVLDQNKDKLVMLMCKAKGCRPCKLFGRKYARAANLYSDAIFLEIFGDESKDTRALMVSMKIKVTPTFVLYRNGERVHSHGGVNESNLHKALQAHLLPTEAGFGQAPVLADESDEE